MERSQHKELKLLCFYNSFLQKRREWDKFIDEISELSEKQVEIISIECHRRHDLCQKYHIVGTPTYVLLSKRKPVFRFYGQIDLSEFAELFGKYL